MLVSAFFPEQLARYTGPASPWYVPSYTVAAQNGLLTGSDVERTPQGEAVEQSVNHLKDMMLLDTIPAAPLRARSPDSSDSAGLTNNPEIRQEMIRLINQTQKDNGVNELDFGIQKEVNQFPK